MTYEVRVGDALADDITRVFGPQRSAEGTPSEWDFWSGPLAAALVAPGVVELAAFARDPDYWSLVEDDPDD